METVKMPLTRASRGLSPEVERQRNRRFGTGASRKNRKTPLTRASRGLSLKGRGKSESPLPWRERVRVRGY